MTYYRIKMGLILPKEIRKYLYLDSDMLAFTDIREFFAIDLQGKIVGAIEDFCFQKDKKMPLRENPQKFDSFYLKEYFCSGMMLVDLEKWREYEVEKKCLEILQKYIPQFPDQDALNLAIEGKNLILPPRWSFFNSVNLETSCKDSPRRCGIYLNCTMAEASEALENAAIMHYSYKPWDEINVYALSSEGRIVTLRDAIPHTFRFFKSWWEMAFQTPFFGKELLLQKIELSKVDLERYAWFMAENNKAKEEAMEKRFSEIFARLNGMESRILEIQKALGQSNMPQNTKENVLQEIKQFQGQIRDIRV